MAKVTFSSLGIKVVPTSKIIKIKEKDIEVKLYLPIQDKLELVARVINNSQDDNNFKNVGKIDVFTNLEIINYYTNITFTEKQKTEPWKLYDIFKQSGLLEQIINIIPKEELDTLYYYINETLDTVYNYRNSVYGILDAMQTDYSDLDLDVDSLVKKLDRPEDYQMLQDVLTKLG